MIGDILFLISLQDAIFVEFVSSCGRLEEFEDTKGAIRNRIS